MNGDAGRRLRIVLRSLTVAARQDFRQSPVHELHLAEGADHDVARFQIPMDDVVGVSIGDRLADLLEDGQEAAALRGVSAAPEHGGERFALDQLHGQERPAIGQAAQVINRRDGGVLELRGDAGLVEEPPRRAGVGAVTLLQQLDCDFALQDRVGGPEDGPHAATGDLVVQPVTLPNGHASRDPWQRVGRIVGEVIRRQSRRLLRHGGSRSSPIGRWRNELPTQV